MAKTQHILCIGGAVEDRKLVLAGPLQHGTSNPVASSRSLGGVARNVCENLARLGVPCALASRVGADAAGGEIIRQLAALGADTSRVVVDPAISTAEYVAVLAGDGGLVLGLANMAAFDALALADLLPTPLPPWIFADCNLPADEMAALVAMARDGAAHLAVDCVSVAKAARLPTALHGITLLFTNADEAHALLGQRLPGQEAALALRARGAGMVVVTHGAQGVWLADAAGTQHLPALAADVVDVTGAGDALIAATLARVAAGEPLLAAARQGLAAAALTLASAHSVRHDLKAALADFWRRTA